MGLYIRKAFNFGPFRLNLSKKGIGTSVGVNGFRDSTEPLGTELTAGRYGLYYREKLANPPQTAAGDIPPVQIAAADDDIPPVQTTSRSGLNFALIVLVVLG